MSEKRRNQKKVVLESSKKRRPQIIWSSHLRCLILWPWGSNRTLSIVKIKKLSGPPLIKGEKAVSVRTTYIKVLLTVESRYLNNESGLSAISRKSSRCSRSTTWSWTKGSLCIQRAMPSHTTSNAVFHCTANEVSSKGCNRTTTWKRVSRSWKSTWTSRR